MRMVAEYDGRFLFETNIARKARLETVSLPHEGGHGGRTLCQLVVQQWLYALGNILASAAFDVKPVDVKRVSPDDDGDQSVPERIV